MKKLLIFMSMLSVALLTACNGADVDDENECDCPEIEEYDVTLHSIEFGPSSGRSMVKTNVVVVDGIIEDVIIDEYEFFAFASYTDLVCVPNGDNLEGFGSNYDLDTVCLASKRQNDEEYSAKMASIGGATQTWVESITAIEDYAVGKTVDDLAGYDSEADTVAGSTLSNTPSYIESIVEAINNG